MNSFLGAGEGISPGTPHTSIRSRSRNCLCGVPVSPGVYLHQQQLLYLPKTSIAAGKRKDLIGYQPVKTQLTGVRRLLMEF